FVYSLFETHPAAPRVTRDRAVMVRNVLRIVVSVNGKAWRDASKEIRQRFIMAKDAGWAKRSMIRKACIGPGECQPRAASDAKEPGTTFRSPRIRHFTG